MNCNFASMKYPPAPEVLQNVVDCSEGQGLQSNLVEISYKAYA